MTRGDSTIKLSELIGGDLKANTGRSGFLAGVSAFISDPSFSAIALHRIMSKTRELGLTFISKLIWRLNVALTSCHIHPAAQIGQSLRLPHPTGIVIGIGSRIGNSVTIYQNVTLGRNLRDENYPSVKDGATIFPNCVLTGGIVIGERSIIGAGSIVNSDVPNDAIFAGNPARLLRMKNDVN